MQYIVRLIPCCGAINHLCFMPTKKPTRYTLSDVLSEYNQDLYEEVAAQITVELQHQPGAWSAHINANGIVGAHQKLWGNWLKQLSPVQRQ